MAVITLQYYSYDAVVENMSDASKRQRVFILPEQVERLTKGWSQLRKEFLQLISEKNHVRGLHRDKSLTNIRLVAERGI